MLAKVQIMMIFLLFSGLSGGVTLGTPIALLVRNKDQRSGDYDDMSLKYRPSHADATYDAKYGVRAVAGGGASEALSKR
jgi:chorismate synthase